MTTIIGFASTYDGDFLCKLCDENDKSAAPNI